MEACVVCFLGAPYIFGFQEAGPKGTTQAIPKAGEPVQDHDRGVRGGRGLQDLHCGKLKVQWAPWRGFGSWAGASAPWRGVGSLLGLWLLGRGFGARVGVRTAAERTRTEESVPKRSALASGHSVGAWDRWEFCVGLVQRPERPGAAQSSPRSRPPRAAQSPPRLARSAPSTRELGTEPAPGARQSPRARPAQRYIYRWVA